MRIGLVAALRRSGEGALRAELPLAGRSVLAWQVALLASLGIERVLCLTESTNEAIFDLQHGVEAGGASFHALKGFAALPALVRAEDDLVILADGLVPDPAVVRALLGGDGALERVVATLPADHPLAADHPEDFERIDATDHWAGVLAMRGAPVQQLADFPADADAISLLLRIALQAGTPRRALAARELAPDNWMLAASAAAMERHETALIAGAAPMADTRAPFEALAAGLVRRLAPEGLVQGVPASGAMAGLLLSGGVAAAAFGPAAAGLAAAGLGAFAARVGLGFRALSARLRRETGARRGDRLALAAVDALCALASWFALAPVGTWQPLAVLGPVTIGLARLAARGGEGRVAALAGDRAGLLLVMALSAGFGRLPEMTACLAVGLLSALLLRPNRT